MRAIDGDALKDRFESLAYDDWNQGVSTSWADAYRQAAEIVEEMPTIERERKTGKWINHRNDRGHNIADCDQCGETMQWYDPDSKPNFCPNCGARMERDYENKGDDD